MRLGDLQFFLILRVNSLAPAMIFHKYPVVVGTAFQLPVVLREKFGHFMVPNELAATEILPRLRKERQRKIVDSSTSQFVSSGLTISGG
jgi:hypothetical protein